MHKKILRRIFLLALTLATLFQFSALAPAMAQGTTRTFPETNHTVQGKFLAYWDSHGALAQQGYPLSEEQQEVSLIDGKTYTTQYFERAIFELHPENQAPNDVLLALAGVFQYTREYPEGAPGQKASTATGAAKFNETGFTIGGKFLDYWNAHGGVAQQGFPISNEFQEKSPLDGKTYTVQYFQRSVFELHPENQAPNDVLLSQLGALEYKQRTDLSFTDWTGTKVTLTKRPQKILCLVALCEDILFSLGLEPIAVNDKYYQNPEFWGPAKTFPAIGGVFAAPNVEDIAKAQPDFIIGFAVHANLRDALKNIAPIFIMNPATYQDSMDYLRKIGYLTGRSYQAERVVRKFYLKLEAYRAQTPNNKVPLIVFGGSANFNIFTQGSLFGGVLNAVQNYPWPAPPPGTIGSTSPEPGALQYSLEQILAKDPDVLLMESAANAPPLSQQLAANPIWSQLKAVKTGQVYEVRRDVYVAGRGPISLGIALDDAMHKIYPDVFTKPLP